jgi:hypothetical protein
MPTYNEITQGGSLAAILFAFIYFVFWGLPAFKKWLDSLLVTFKEEIQKERARGDARVDAVEARAKDDREAAERVTDQRMKMIDRNSDVVDGLRVDVQHLIRKGAA